MFVSINRLKVKAGCGDQLEERFAHSQGLEQTPGFLQFQLLKRTWQPHGKDDHEEYLAMTQWTSQQAFLDWTKSDAFKKAHSGPKPDIFAGPGEPAGYEVAVDRGP